MALRFRWRVDVIKAFKGPHPAQPKAYSEDQQKQADNKRQTYRMRRLRVQIGAKDYTDTGAQDQQRHASAAHHCQTILCQFARLRHFTLWFVCHSIAAFIDDTLLRWCHFALEPLIRQA